MKNILLFEPDKETATLFCGWLNDVGCSVSSTDSLEKIPFLLAEKKFNIVIVDIYSSEDADLFLKLCPKLKSDPRFSGLPITVITYQKEIEKIARFIEGGVENFMLKPFDADSFLVRMDTILDEHKLALKGKKALDLNYITYLIELGSQSEREGFFVLAPVIFNKLIIEKINKILGEPIIVQIIKRVNEMIGEDYEFMKSVEFSGKGLSMDDVNKVSSDISVKKLALAFRDYVYGFLHLVGLLTSDVLMEQGKEEALGFKMAESESYLDEINRY